MAVAIPFDTLEYARKLESAGVPAAQAELQATALGEALAKVVAAPADLVMLESRLGGRIDAIDAKIGMVKIDQSRRWLGRGSARGRNAHRYLAADTM